MWRHCLRVPLWRARLRGLQGKTDRWTSRQAAGRLHAAVSLHRLQEPIHCLCALRFHASCCLSLLSDLIIAVPISLVSHTLSMFHSLQGFFRRSIQQNINYKMCVKNEKCLIMRMNRNRCQHCRFKKCIGVGMSRDGESYGFVGCEYAPALVTSASCHYLFSEGEGCSIQIASSTFSPQTHFLHSVVNTV